MVSFLAYNDQTKRYKDITRIHLVTRTNSYLCFTRKTRFCSGTPDLYWLSYCSV